MIYQEIADLAANRIKDAITLSLVGENPVKAILDAYNPTGSTAYVNFTTSKETRWQHAVRLTDVQSAAAETACDSRDALAVLGLLSSRSAQLLTMKMTRLGSDNAPVSDTEFVRRLTDWLREKTTSDAAWKAWASKVEVKWVAASLGQEAV